MQLPSEGKAAILRRSYIPRNPACNAGAVRGAIANRTERKTGFSKKKKKNASLLSSTYVFSILSLKLVLYLLEISSLPLRSQTKQKVRQINNAALLHRSSCVFPNTGLGNRLSRRGLGEERGCRGTGGAVRVPARLRAPTLAGSRRRPRAATLRQQRWRKKRNSGG